MLLDSYAWIEFFKGSEKGEKVWNVLKATLRSKDGKARTVYEESDDDSVLKDRSILDARFGLGRNDFGRIGLVA